MNHYAVFLAGGSGTRFWPLSRRSRPKQLLPLAPGGRTLLRASVERVAPLFRPEQVLVVTAGDLAPAVRAEIPDLPPENVIVEPAPRNTAPAAALAASWLARRDPNAVMAILPADHHVDDEDTFRRVLERAATLAEDGRIVCLGVEPTRPETGYGWLELAPAELDVLSVVRFVEKPDAARAASFLASGRYAWNSGMFFLRGDYLLELLNIHLPEFAAELWSYTAGEIGLAALFAGAPSVSLDHGIMEKQGGLVALRLACGWNDVGSWDAVGALFPQDGAGNAAVADLVAVDASGCVVHAPGKPVALVGVRDLVVVETPDALLVCPRDRAQDVRRVVDALRARGREDLL